MTLLNDTKSVQQKVQETMEIVSKWEIEPPIISNQMMTPSSVRSLLSHCTYFKATTFKLNCTSYPHLSSNRLCFLLPVITKIIIVEELQAYAFFSSHFEFVRKFCSWCHFEGIDLEIKFRPRGKWLDKNEVGAVKTPTGKCKICKLLVYIFDSVVRS